MSFFNSLKDKFNAGRDELTKQAGRYKNRAFLEGTVAVCARIAVASDGVSSEEKQKMMGFLRASPELSIFDTNEVIQFFEKLVTSFSFDMEVGKGETMKYILALKNKPEQAQLAVRVGIAVAKSDGDFDATEQANAREIIQALGFQPAEFGL
ncbi:MULTISPECIES: tellurite resistance TerB family protein [Erwiniaceae]|uniref:tellurite resistance TerB family protein n=1 Tax=Erwiniaceae TaxID=1903409 RepID=UPI000535B932|nr:MULTISPECIES: tellurite resistance TerB family protein [Erwiniaceae]AJA70912.1 Tellurium resistance protein TerB [Pantoea sp. PSNIH1]QNH53190.1 tellurite resistance TerB family protein [Acinetobacter venetianus]UBB14876.1 tellurite resistance TerB family protein [Pantoea eucrina]